MNFNDKFLNVCFKIGKVGMSILLVILVLVGIGFIFNASYKTVKMNNIPLEYKFQSEDTTEAANNNSLSSEDLKIEKEKVEKLYKNEIAQIVKENKASEKAVNNIISDLVNVQKADRKDYVNNLSQYYKDLEKYFIDKINSEYPDMSEKEIEEFFKNNQVREIEIPRRYFVRYNRQIAIRDEAKQALQTARINDLIALLVCISIFLVSLMIPILIRIEENTRR